MSNPIFELKPRVATKIPKMRLKVAMKLIIIFEIEAQGCYKLLGNFGLKCIVNKQKKQN